MRQELSASVDKLPSAWCQARKLRHRWRRPHHQTSQIARKQVWISQDSPFLDSQIAFRLKLKIEMFEIRRQVVADRGAIARKNRQRYQEPLEHSHQAEAHQGRNQSKDSSANQTNYHRRNQLQQRFDHHHHNRQHWEATTATTEAATKSIPRGRGRAHQPRAHPRAFSDSIGVYCGIEAAADYYARWPRWRYTCLRGQLPTEKWRFW